MGHELVTIKIEIDPRVGTAAFRASEQLAVEAPRLGQVAYGKSKMKQGNRLHDSSL
jgi:hypothetical protein